MKSSAAAEVMVSDGTMSCPVPSPAGLPCSKRIPAGWVASEGHGGGHFWVSPEVEAIFDGGHFDASAALAGLPFEGHLPQDCRPGCPKWRERSDR
ncbi:hypothetical protein [Nonomuraea dietziae]|uniref:hypothetical protein n=1 Tax=Nonomuraea dietziae TaxID=65515 RepID=UPI0033FE60ED